MAAILPYYTVDDLEQLPRDGNRYELVDGVLLVTPAPGPAHQIIVSRIVTELAIAVQKQGHGFVYSEGAVSFPPRTQLQPDVLVVPATASIPEKWSELREYWLAVEVYSHSSRIYDHDFKRENYHRLGVQEVWLVDRIERTVEISRGIDESEIVSGVVLWRPPTLDIEVRVHLNAIFAGL